MKKFGNNKIVTYLLLPVLSLALMLSAVLSSFGGISAANADSSWGDLNPEESEYENIFYFSDSDSSHYYYENYLEPLAESYAFFHPSFGNSYHYNINDDKFFGYPSFINYEYNAFQFFDWCIAMTEEWEYLNKLDIKNSLIFFECDSEFYRKIFTQYEAEEMLEILGAQFLVIENYFKELKKNGCKIILLLQYDEYKLYNDTGNCGYYYDFRGFLDYVDVHVDYDMMYVLLATLYGEMEEDTNDPYTVFLDYYCSQPWFIQKYLLPHYFADENSIVLNVGFDEFERAFSGTSADIYYENTRDIFENLMEVKNVQIIVTLADDTFMDLASGRTYEVNSSDYDEIKEIVRDGNLAAFGYYGTKLFDEWIYNIEEIGKLIDKEITTYIYNYVGSVLSDYSTDYIDEVTCYNGRWYLENFMKWDYQNYEFLAQLMYDAVCLDDLTHYFNPSDGTPRCLIYHKTLYGSGGRLRGGRVAGLGIGDCICVG